MADDPELPPASAELVGCYLDATVPDERRADVRVEVDRRLEGRMGGSRAQVLAIVHEVVEQHLDLPLHEAGAVLVRDCGLTPLAASLIVGVNERELRAALGDAPQPDEGPTAAEDLDADAMAVLLDDGAEPSPGRAERFTSWVGGRDAPSRPWLPVTAAALAAVTVAVVAVALGSRSGEEPDVLAPPPQVLETAPPAPPPADGDAPAADTVLGAAGGGELAAGQPAVLSLRLGRTAGHDLRWSLSRDGREVFAPTPLAVPPAGRGEVRLVVPPALLARPGTYVLTVSDGARVVAEHRFHLPASPTR